MLLHLNLNLPFPDLNSKCAKISKKTDLQISLTKAVRKALSDVLKEL